MRADFFVVPIPLGATLVWGQNQLLKEAYGTLFNTSLFQQHPERHVAAFATTEKAFGWQWWGLSNEEMKKFQSTIVVRDSSNYGNNWPNSGKCSREKDRAFSYFRHIITLGLGGEGSKPDNPYNNVTAESWNKKQFWYFYHTRTTKSLCNSSQFRHRFFTNLTNLPANLELFDHQPFSIGFDIPQNEWKKSFSDSKFCLVIRGDNAASRALTRAIRAGCIPLIVSDFLPVYQSFYTKTLQVADFSVLVKEEDFLYDPIRSLDNAISLSKTKLEEKLEGLRLMQRIVTADKSDTLFVPAFAREVVETMKEEGLTTGPISTLCNSTVASPPVLASPAITDTIMLSCLKQILLHSDGTPRTADTGDYGRWNESIQMARASPMPQLQHGTDSSPCIVLEIGAKREAKRSQEHIKKYPNCQYHAYEIIPQYAKELKEHWKDEPRMYVHPYGLGENETEIMIDIEALDGLSTFVGDSEGDKKDEMTMTGQIKSFDFALSEIGQLHNRTADSVIPTLLDINCEGCEYNLLLQAKKHGFIERVPVILIGWHAYGNDGVGARAWELCQTCTMLSETHEMAYGLGFGWERWVLKS